MIGSHDLWCISNSVFYRENHTIPHLLNGPEVLLVASEKAKFFAELFSKNSNPGNSGHELPILNIYSSYSSWNF